MIPTTTKPASFTRRCLLAAACGTAFVPSADAIDWIPRFGINYWGDSTIWDGGVVPDGPGMVANLTGDLVTPPVTVPSTPSTSVSLGTSISSTAAVTRTLGTLIIGDTTAASTTGGIPIQLTAGSPSFIFDTLDGSNAILTTATSTAVQTSGPPSFSAVQLGSLLIKDNLTVTNNLGPASGSYSNALPSLQIGKIDEDPATAGRRVTFASNLNVGTTSINGDGNYSGGTDLQAGRVSIATNAAFGTGSVSIGNGAQVVFNVSAPTFSTVANNFVLNGNGWSEQSGTRGALLFAPNNTTTARTLTLTGGIQVASASRIETQSSNMTAVLAGNLTGSSALTTGGSGTVRLTGNNSGYTGTLTVAGGRLDLVSNVGGSVAVSGGLLAGKGTIAGNLALSGGTGLEVTGGPGILHVGGDVSVSSPTSVQPVSFTTGSQTLLTYGGSLTGGGNLQLEGGNANYHAGSHVDVSQAGSVTVRYQTATATWNGGAGGFWFHGAGSSWAGNAEGIFAQGDDVNFNGAAPGVVYLSGKVHTGTITFSGSNNYTLDADAASGIVTGSLVKNGSGILTFGETATTGNTTLDQHSYAGGTTINDGRIRLSVNSHSTNGTGPLGTGAITMNGGALSGAGTSTTARSILNLVRFNGNLTLGDSVDTNVMLLNGGVNVTANSTVHVASEVRIGSGTTSPGLSGSANFTKTGTGLLILNSSGSSNNFTGTLSVQAGTFRIGNGTTLEIASGGSFRSEGGAVTAGNTSSRLVIKEGATLGGTGGIDVNTTVEGIHAVGNSPGLQTFSTGLAYSASATFAMEMVNPAAARGVGFDAVDVTGGSFSIAPGADLTLALDGSINFADSYWDSSRQWLVIDLGTGVTGNGGTDTFSIAGVTGGMNYSAAEGYFSTSRITDANSKNDLYLTWNAVPEPSAALLGLLGLGACLRRRRD